MQQPYPQLGTFLALLRRSYDLGVIFRGEGRKTTDTVLTTVTRLKIGA